MLIADNISYETGKRMLVRDISFSIRPGEMLVVLGANGAGKSTLLRMLSGERKPSKGSLTLHHKEVSHYSPPQLALKRAVLNQQNVVNMAFMAAEIVMMGRYPHYQNAPSPKDRQICEEVMKLTGTTHLSERSYLSLSGGEQQRIQLSRILVQIWDVPDALLLMDEPVSGLDLQYQQQTLAIAQALSKKGFMVISILHDINLAAQYADRILMLKNGRKWYDGTASEVLNTKNIYEVFEIDSEVFTNPRTLKPFFIPKNTIVNLTPFS
ncbi:heme ABC transporter ATP-binding protein [Pedobacter steynii]|uniref:Hemin ABC transporter ATP-binding protein n=1 Tax=Pedobacter steynii TaxID=430522 RepID=A0A1D7QK73_9SPHI|nr:heme ABC transporter ATP-binding protein [Pedobacter steynii]AOM79013.1 hemin ABC transporter ATP-binding protein [Pedobacter steynii]